ncbi:hypothetical protein AAVH_01953 [Aphelenchoides avenae]|nr:hypothetical protein AAVH_01953 [Aphelenchus avenae]
MKKWYNANSGAREFADHMALGADPYYTMKWAAVPAGSSFVPDKRMDDVMGLELEPGRLEWNFNRL